MLTYQEKENLIRLLVSNKRDDVKFAIDIIINSPEYEQFKDYILVNNPNFSLSDLIKISIDLLNIDGLPFSRLEIAKSIKYGKIF